MEMLLMGGIVAFTLFTLISYILILLNIPILIIPVLFLALFFYRKSLNNTFKTIKKSILTIQLSNHLTIITILVFIIGIAGQLAVISPSGIFKNGDLLFWSAHGHDGAWHIALMEEMKKNLPLQNPIFAGERLVNYHFFSDILPAMVSKYTPLSNLDLYFRIFPFFYSLFLGASVYFLTKKITKNVNAPIWATIFTYFSGSFGFIVTYLKNKSIGGESIFWATQPQSSSGNPPQIISNFLFLSAIYYVIKFQKEKKYFWHCLLLLGTISSFKIYAGVVILLSVGLYGLWRFIKTKKFDLLLLSGLSGIIALLLYLPNSSGSVSFLIYEPWWYIRTMIVEPSRLNLLDWELRRQTYIYEHNWKRVIWLEGLGFLIFFFGNLGMRFLGLWEFVKTNLIFKIAIIISLVIPLLFLQKGVASNTSQFLQYFVLLFGILAGIAVSKIRKPISYILTPIFLFLMIPTQIGLLQEFYSRPAFAKVSAHELQALEFIKQNTDKNSIIITPPYNQYTNLGDTTPYIWDWFDTSYVSAHSSRRTYFDDYEQVDIMGYDYKLREEVKKTIFESSDTALVKTAFDSTNASILYFPKLLQPKINPNDLGLSKIFENKEVELWKQ